MLFYDDPLDFDDTVIQGVSKFDMAQKVDTVLVVGTSLSKDVRGTRDLVQRLCSPRYGSPTHTVWINPQLPPKDLDGLFNIVILASSDYVAEIQGGTIVEDSHATDLTTTRQADNTRAPTKGALSARVKCPTFQYYKHVQTQEVLCDWRVPWQIILKHRGVELPLGYLRRGSLSARAKANNPLQSLPRL